MTKRDELHTKIKEILLNAKPFRHHKSADDILDTIYAELQEPNEVMIEAEKSIRKQTQERLEQSEGEVKALRTELAKLKQQKPIGEG